MISLFSTYHVSKIIHEKRRFMEIGGVTCWDVPVQVGPVWMLEYSGMSLWSGPIVIFLRTPGDAAHRLIVLFLRTQDEGADRLIVLFLRAQAPGSPGIAPRCVMSFQIVNQKLSKLQVLVGVRLPVRI